MHRPELYAVLAVAALIAAADAFQSLPLIQRRSSTTVTTHQWHLQAVADDDGGTDDKDDIEAMRRQLQSIVGEDTNVDVTTDVDSLQRILGSAKDGEVSLPPPPPLTSIDRERREVEMELLESLKNGDEALQELWNLWFSEKGLDAQEKLKKTDEYLTHPHRWDEAESVLKGMVEEYGIYFVEPLNRLATLYFLQRRLEESYSLCLIVLSVKPWHFGALSGMVAVCMGRNDGANARLWADRRLPPAAPRGTGQPRRLAWIERALTDAKASMELAERRTAASFGLPDEHSLKTDLNEDKAMGESNNFIRNIDDDEDAWQ